jgi:glutamine synthetase
VAFDYKQIKTPADVLKLVKDNEIKYIDIRFTDWPGTWQHFTIPAHELDEKVFTEGLGFDGSSIRGWKSIEASDMLVVPDASTARVDPFFDHSTLVIAGDVVEPGTMEPYAYDPRHIAKKAEAYLKSTGIGDTAFFGPEAEFFLFNNVQYKVTPTEVMYKIDSEEGHWNSGKDEGPNLGYKIRAKEGYIPCPPIDQQQDVRSQMCEYMAEVGLVVERQHHEVATAGQAEIDLRFSPLVDMCDQMNWYKYIVRQTARQYGLTATFMPKPLFGDNGSGMHCHQSIWKDGKPLFAGDKYAGLSEMALYYIGGILKHAPAIVAITNPTVNSYRRLVPGYEAPVRLAYSARNRSAAIRIPVYSPSPKAKRIEFRTPDPSTNCYLAFAAMLMAGLDGIQNKILPGEPMDKNIYGLPPEELAKIPNLPGSLDEALNALEADHEFLLKGDVFTKDAVENWINYKREKDLAAFKFVPHPKEYELYFDV